MRARQFEVGNERRPFSFERGGDLGRSDATSSYMSARPLCLSLPLSCFPLGGLKEERAERRGVGTTASRGDLEMKYQPRPVRRR